MEAEGRARMAMRDTPDTVGGKWNLVLISIVREETFRFNELNKLSEISPRILSKELKELETNGLVERKVLDTRPVTVEYSLAPFSQTLSEVIMAMRSWGVQHRKKNHRKIMGTGKSKDKISDNVVQIFLAFFADAHQEAQKNRSEEMILFDSYVFSTCLLPFLEKQRLDKKCHSW